MKHPVDESESSRPKRFRMLTKGPAEETPDNIADQWREVLESLAPKLPRVGRSEITCPETIQRIQKLIGTQNEIKTIVGGKGMNRTTAPLRRFETGEAPGENWFSFIVTPGRSMELIIGKNGKTYQRERSLGLVTHHVWLQRFSQVIPVHPQLWNSCLSSAVQKVLPIQS